jgi:lysyl-tRNA synthetase class 2
MIHNTYYEVRLQKVEELNKLQGTAYIDSFQKDYSCEKAKLLPADTKLSIAGRVILKRDMGKLTFLHIQDVTGSYQIALKRDITPNYKEYVKLIDNGDHLGVSGTTFFTMKGEPTLQAEKCVILTKGLHSLPDKVEGLKDGEAKARRRYLDLISNEDSRKRFSARLGFIADLKKQMLETGFLEVETPILQSQASGANAKPFKTHHNSLDMDMYLRIAPETYLKRLIAAGYDKIFEVGKLFRNEGIDPSHLQEFTNIEWYAAYWNWENNKTFTKNLLDKLIRYVQTQYYGNHSNHFHYQGTLIDFSSWSERTYGSLLREHAGIDLIVPGGEIAYAAIVEQVKEKNLPIDVSHYPDYYSLVESIYKKLVRPKLINPTIITHYPSDMAPLARSNDKNSGVVDMFQVVINGWEVVKAYSELVDPVEQRKRLEAQVKDKEGMPIEEDFIECMEYGIPPTSGGAIGIDRMVTLLTDSANVRDVVYFPFLKTEAV